MTRGSSRKAVLEKKAMREGYRKETLVCDLCPGRQRQQTKEVEVNLGYIAYLSQRRGIVFVCLFVCLFSFV